MGPPPGTTSGPALAAQALQSRLPPEVLTLSGGSASNVARTLAGLGLTVQLLTSCGSDPCGSAFLDRLQQAGVDTLHTHRYPGPTAPNPRARARARLKVPFGSALWKCETALSPTAATHVLLVVLVLVLLVVLVLLLLVVLVVVLLLVVLVMWIYPAVDLPPLASPAPPSLAWLPAGQCVVLCAEGQRTMRTFLHPGGVLRAADVEERAFRAASSGVVCGAWVFLSAYLAYSPGLMQRCGHLARRCGRRVALDLASFEVVRTFWPDLLALLAAGAVDVCVCNEDEAAAVAACLSPGLPASCLNTASTEQATSAPDQAQGRLSSADAAILQPSSAGTNLSKTPLGPGSAGEGTAAHLATRWPAQCAALDFLSRHCKGGAVVTLGAQGCLAAGAVSAAPDTGSTQVPSRAVGQVPPQGCEVDHLAATARCSAGAVAVDEGRPTAQHAKPDGLHAGPSAQLPLLSAGHVRYPDSGPEFGNYSRLEWCHQPAIAGVVVVDSTGAGDAFTSGLLYGLTQGHALTSPQCLRMGCVAGAAAVLGLGAELTPAGWAFCKAHMASSLSS
ncbi:hypothetical protein QJQ45_026903 [Haematococcus lacustris]|nr:hypothetical protein QJQ45_026903 [Haematococcus lacustris]